MINNDINIIEVITPTDSTNRSNSGVTPLRSLGVDFGSVNCSIEGFVIPRSNSVEFECNMEFFMSWDI